MKLRFLTIDFADEEYGVSSNEKYEEWKEIMEKHLKDYEEISEMLYQEKKNLITNESLEEGESL